MGALWRDVRFGLRMLVKSPGFSAVAILTLALGIGANTAIFSAVNAVLLRPLPFPDSDRLVLMWEKSRQLATMMVAYPDYLDWRAQNQVFEDVAVYNRYRSMNLTGTDQPERLRAAAATANIFRVLGVGPAIGRGFSAEEDQPGGHRAVILSYGFWQRRFGGASSFVGQSLTLDGQSYNVVGVLPRDFQFAGTPDIWVPLGLFVDEGMLNRQNHPGLVALARMKSGVALERARVEMNAIAGRLEQQYPESNTEVGVSMEALRELAVGGIRRTLFMLAGAVGFVLLIACANVANLLLARATARQRELAVRAALGASWVRLLRQLLTESLLLALAGGAAGLLLAMWSVDLLRKYGLGTLPRASGIGIDPWVLAFTLGISILSGVLFGLAPLRQVRGISLQEVLKEGGRGGAGIGRSRLRGLLVVGEVALSLTLLVGAGLLVRSFVRLVQVQPGFRSSHVMTMNVALPPAKYPTGEPSARFFRQALEQLRAVPGVESAAVVDPLPFGPGGWQVGISIEGRPEPRRGVNPLVDAATVSPDYFRSMSIPLLAGRDFTQQDDGNAPLVVIVSQTMAQTFWPNENPIGKRIKFGGAESNEPWRVVVGVAGDVKRVGLEVPFRAEMYLPYLQQPLRALTLVVRTAGDPASLAPALRATVRAVDKDQPVFDVRTMKQLLESSLAQRQFSMTLLGFFSAVALLLAAAGLYGVVAYLVAQRTHEIGVRMALGARPADVLRLVVGYGMRLTLTGLATGVVAALGLTQFISSLLFGVKPHDLLTFASVAAVLAIAALLACYIPARRAARMDPMVALRYE